MRDDLLSLLELSKINKIIYNLRKSNRDLPIRVGTLEGEINSAEKKLNDINQSIMDYENKIEENKSFTIEEQENLETSNKRLENISTNKEYDAIHTEIATHKKNIEDAKANTIHFQQILENLKEDKKSVEESYNNVVEANSPELTQLRQELDSLEGRISEQESLGEKPRSAINKRVLSIYDRLLQRRKTPFVISTVNWDKKVCEICNRAQPPQKLNEISRMNSIINCESCGGILIWDESESTEEKVEEQKAS